MDSKGRLQNGPGPPPILNNTFFRKKNAFFINDFVFSNLQYKLREFEGQKNEKNVPTLTAHMVGACPNFTIFD